MKDNNSKGYSPVAQLGFFIGLIGVGMIVSSLLSAGIWSMMTHRPLAIMEKEMANPAYYSTVMIIQAVSTIFMMFLPVIIFAVICYRKPAVFIGSKTPVSTKQFLIVMAIVVVLFPLGGALAELNRIIPIPDEWAARFHKMEDDRKAMENIFVNINTLPKYLLSILVIAILPGIVEELCFRAGLQNILERWFSRTLTAILVTSVIFSLIHLSYYGFLVRFVLGVVLGYIYYFSGSIWLPVFLHFLFNGVQVTALYMSKSFGKINADDLDKNLPLWAGIPALILIIWLIQLFVQESNRLRQQYIYREPDDPQDIHDWIA